MKDDSKEVSAKSFVMLHVLAFTLLELIGKAAGAACPPTVGNQNVGAGGWFGQENAQISAGSNGGLMYVIPPFAASAAVYGQVSWSRNANFAGHAITFYVTNTKYASRSHSQLRRTADVHSWH